MDFSDTASLKLESTKDYIVAYGHLKLIRDRSKNDKDPNYGRTKFINKSRRNAQCNESLNINVTKSLDTSAVDTEYLATTSKPAELRTRIKNNANEEKLKPSLIPRLKSNMRELSAKGPSISSFKKRSEFKNEKPIVEHKNVQRVQHLNIHQEFSPDGQSTSKSVASSRPIPALAHLYGENSSNDILADLYLETTSIYGEVQENNVNSNETMTATYFSTEKSSVATSATNNTNESHNSTLPILKKMTSGLKTFKTTDENVRDWLSSELDHPTRDDETGCQLVFPKNLANFNIKSNNLEILKSSQNEMKFNMFETNDKNSKLGMKLVKANSSNTLIEEQSTIVMNSKWKTDSSKISSLFGMPKVNTDVKVTKNFKTDIHKPLKYPSTPNPLKRKRVNTQSVHVASYVEYPSEVLQKTTNFETQGCDTLSLISGVNLESHNDLTSLNERFEEDVADINTEWCAVQSSQDTTIGKSSKTSNITVESWRSKSYDKRESYHFKCPDKSSYHDYYYHYCWRKEVAKKHHAEQGLWDYKGRCKKCQKCRYSRHVGKKLNKHRDYSVLRNFTISAVPGPFQGLKKHISFGRICRHRWNRVWKKTAEKWSNWSKSHSTFWKSHVINKQKSINWDTATVQTTIHLYNEMGTNGMEREQKSAEITAALSSWSRYNNGKPAPLKRSIKSGFKHANVGPSLFTFVNASMLTRKSLNQTKTTSYYAHSLYNNEAKSKEIGNVNYLSFKQNNLLNGASFTGSKPITLKRNVKENNTATEKNTPDFCTKNSKCVQRSMFSYMVHTATEPITLDRSSLRSMNIMTSKGIVLEKADRETQVSPPSFIEKISTGVFVQGLIPDAKSNVVTDTVVPCRRFDNTIVTRKGTILSCTGTKITSVSSDNIRTASTSSRIAKALHTATSTNFETREMDCFTAASLYRRDLQDTSLGTIDLKADTSEKSICPLLKNVQNIGLSAITLSGGSQSTQCSCGAGCPPECRSMCTNTDTELISKSTETRNSFDRQIENTSEKIKADCFVQYSNFCKESTQNMARIGGSQLLSVRALMNAEAATQKSTCFTNKGTNNQTSQNIIGSSVPVANGPNFVISSNLNAAKWMKGYGKEDDRDVQSIIDISETTVKESLERASFIITHSKYEIIDDIRRLSKVLNNQQPAINCVTEKPLGVKTSSTVKITNGNEEVKKSLSHTNTDNKPSKNIREPIEKSFIVNEPEVLVTDKTISDEVIKDLKESVVQVLPDLQDTGTNCSEEQRVLKSNFALTSRHILPRAPCCGFKNTDCVFVYDQPRCVMHNYKVDAAVQWQFSCKNIEYPSNKASKAIGQMTSFIGNINSTMKAETSSSKDCKYEATKSTSNKPGSKISEYKNKEISQKSDQTDEHCLEAVDQNISSPICIDRSPDLPRIDHEALLDEFVKSQIKTYCRQYMKVLSLKLEQIKESFRKQLTPSIDKIALSASITDLFIEACTMKPSGKKDENCQTKSQQKEKIFVDQQIFIPEEINFKNQSCDVSQVLSLIDVRKSQDKNDLKAVYYILTAIEGRVRRLKNNLQV